MYISLDTWPGCVWAVHLFHVFDDETKPYIYGIYNGWKYHIYDLRGPGANNFVGSRVINKVGSPPDSGFSSTIFQQFSCIHTCIDAVQVGGVKSNFPQILPCAAGFFVPGSDNDLDRLVVLMLAYLSLSLDWTPTDWPRFHLASI